MLVSLMGWKAALQLSPDGAIRQMGCDDGNHKPDEPQDPSRLVGASRRATEASLKDVPMSGDSVARPGWSRWLLPGKRATPGSMCSSRRERDGKATLDARLRGPNA